MIQHIMIQHAQIIFQEGWHKEFYIVVGKPHPSLYTCVEKMRKKQAVTEAMFRQLQLGQQVNKYMSECKINAFKSFFVLIFEK